MGNENPVEAGQFLSEDGMFQENWRDHLTGDGAEDLQADETLKNIKGVQGMAKMLVDGQSTIGKLSGGRDFTILPNEQSSDDERAAHFTKLGRPVDVAGYELAKIGGEKANPEYMAKMGQVMFDSGVSKANAASLVTANNEFVAAMEETIKSEQKIADQQANVELRKVLGSAYDQEMAKGIFAINSIAAAIDPEFAAGLIADMPHDVNAARFLIKIGNMISEDGGLPENPAAMTPADIQGKIDEALRDPYYMSAQPEGKPFDQGKHDAIMKKVQDLFKLRHPG